MFATIFICNIIRRESLAAISGGLVPARVQDMEEKMARLQQGRAGDTEAEEGFSDPECEQTLR